MSALEQSFVDLCAKHDAHCVAVGIDLYQGPPNARWQVCIQWGEDGCAIGNCGTLSEALTSAVSQMRIKRGLHTPEGPTLADEPLPVEG